jgi:hypothetical protein
MPWWSWMLFGAALLGVEIMVPGSFFVLFFGVGALLVGALVGLGLGGEAWLQWLLFSAFSVLSLLAFRSRLLARFQRSRASSVGTETFVGETATLLDDLAPGAVGKAELRGSVWTVRSRDAQALRRGQLCRVENVDGLTLWVRAHG